MTYKFDGDGRNVIQREFDGVSSQYIRSKKYEVWSSVIGKPLVEYGSDWSNGQWYISLKKLNVYDASGTKIAVGPHLQWENIAPSNSSVISVTDHPLGQVVGRGELTPFGSEVSFEPPENPPTPPDNLPQTTPEMGSIEAEYTAMCTLNGLDVLCRQILGIMRSGECEYASCAIKDSHGDYIFEPEAEFGPHESIGDPCGFDEICMLGFSAFFERNRNSLLEATQQHELSSILNRIAQQQETPKILSAPNDAARAAVKDAYNEALARLRNSACRELFTNFYDNFVQTARESNDFDIMPEEDAAVFRSVLPNLERDPSSVLRSISFSVYPSAQPPRVDSSGNLHVTGAQTNSRNSVFITTDGVFFSRTQQVNGRTYSFLNAFGAASLTQTQFAALLLLHELGHAYGEGGGIYAFFGPDAQDGNRNREHTQQIINSCFPELTQNSTP